VAPTKLYKSNAARQRAYRERKAAEIRALRTRNVTAGAEQLPDAASRIRPASPSSLSGRDRQPEAERNVTAEADEDFVYDEDLVYDRETPKGKGTYRVTLVVAAARLKTIQKEAEEVFGEMLLEVSKVETATSKAARLADAEEMIAEAKSMVEELKGEIESWKESLPENLQYGAKAEELDEAISALEEKSEQLGDIDFSDIRFPGMY
jgi:DNA repair exonuclease SbcCD ATPase subunit